MSNVSHNSSFRTIRLIAPCIVAALLAGSWADFALADFQAMARRLPTETSAVVAVNVEKVLESPYAKDQRWAEGMADSWAKRPQMVAPGVTRLLMGADVTPSTMESIWEVCLMEMNRMPELEALAKAEGGYIDRVWDKNAVASPINAYFVPLDGNILATITPAERRAIAKWVRQPVSPQGNVTSNYVMSILSGLTDQTDVTMAMDLEAAFGVPKIRLFLEESDAPELKDRDLDSLAATLDSLKGLALNIHIDQKINGTLLIDFGMDAASLGPVAKPLLIEVLNRGGMAIDELSDWTFATNGKQVSATGELTEGSLRRLLGVIQSPIPAIVAPTAPAGATASASASDPAAASQRYFKSICMSVDSFREGASMSATAGWLKQAAKRIDQLPILNVDPALVEWGALVSSTLKQAAATLSVNQTQTNSRVAGVKNPEYGGHYDDNNNYHWNRADRAARENAQRERRQAAMDQKARGHEQALKILDGLTGRRQEIRAQMTAKYNVEF